VKLLFDRILLRLVDQSNVSKGGIIMPDISLDNSAYRYAEVVAVGTGRPTSSGALAPLSVVPGDFVMFLRNSSSGKQVGVPYKGEELLMTDEAWIAMIFEPNELKRETGLIGLDGLDLGLKDAMVHT
jgi:co-chaperonin GroES (HSP10)